MTEHKQVNREDDLKFCLFFHMMSRKAFKIRGIDDFERALEAIAYSSGKEDDTSDESSDSDTDSHYSGDADDVDLDVYPGRQCQWMTLMAVKVIKMMPMKDQVNKIVN